MKEAIEYLSFGAGPPSLALGILNAWGEVEPKAQLIVFADTGWEKAETMRLLPIYEAWFAEQGMELITVQAKEGPLQEHIRNRSVPVPAHTERGIQNRQCTDKWKIAPIEQYLHARFGKNTPLIAQLGMTWDEVDRLRDPRVKRNVNRWPLVEKRLRRDATIEIIRMAGLPVPPASACLGCPLQGDGRWRVLAAQHPDDFAEAVEIDNFLRSQPEKVGYYPRWLHYTRRPLERIYAPGQMMLPLADDGDEGLCESGLCFT
tara:strand:- start:98 stop:877 length:780 start_codon:yes stop_codon:yes gene_type:complete